MGMDRYEKITSFDALYAGLKKARRNVMWKDSTSGYSYDGLKNTVKLQDALRSGEYEIMPYQRFMIHEPKEREIVATRIRDRQFQRSLCDEALYREMTRGFIHDNCACQRGKGVDFALDRLEVHLRRYYREHGKDGWVLRCDIRKYFPQTRHDTAKAAIRKRVKDEWPRRMAEQIVDSFGGDRGIGLGSQVSQLIELAVLDDMDHHIKERLRIKHYIRYMDDFILIHQDRETMERALAEIRRRVEALGLELNAKTQIAPMKQGIIFLKWRFTVTETGKVIRKMDGRSVTKERRKLKKLAGQIQRGRIPEEYMWMSFQSWRANAERGNTHYQIARMTKLYKELQGRIRTKGEEEHETGKERGADLQGGPAGGSGGGEVREDGGAAGNAAGGRSGGRRHAGAHRRPGGSHHGAGRDYRRGGVKHD